MYTGGSGEVSQNLYRVLGPGKGFAGLGKGCMRSGHGAISIGCGVDREASAHRSGREWKPVSSWFKDRMWIRNWLCLEFIPRLLQPGFWQYRN